MVSARVFPYGGTTNSGRTAEINATYTSILDQPQIARSRRLQRVQRDCAPPGGHDDQKIQLSTAGFDGGASARSSRCWQERHLADSVLFSFTYPYALTTGAIVLSRAYPSHQKAIGGRYILAGFLLRKNYLTHRIC